MNKSLIQLTIIGIVLILGMVIILSFFPGVPRNGTFDAFAKCLAEKKITMYGADWCPHCQNEKRAFGDSFRFVPYVECPDNPQLCLAAGIRGYPTWIFPDGKKLEGEQGIKKLSNESGCPLPAPNN